MKPLTEEWVSKAEDDYIVALKMFRARKQPVYDAVCYHAQQCAEKYLKAILQEHDVPIPKTHKLLDLLKLVKQIDATVEILLSDLQVIRSAFREHSLSWHKR
ncbi:MAG: HEPN domain-containing protein [Anaerolineales bacterium]